MCLLRYFFFFKQKTAYEMRISDWSSDVCSSDLFRTFVDQQDDQVDFRMIVADGMGDVLQQHRLAGARRRHDQGALALALRGDQEIGRASCRERVCQYV